MSSSVVAAWGTLASTSTAIRVSHSVRMAAATLVLVSVIGIPFGVAATWTLKEHGEDMVAEQTRAAGLDILDHERAFAYAIRSLRSETIARRRVDLGESLAVDRSLSRLEDAIESSPFAQGLHDRALTLRSTWERVQDRDHALGALDAVLVADEDLVTAVSERARLTDSPDQREASALMLLVTILPSIADGVDQQRNLVLAAAAARRVPNGTTAASEIFEAQESRQYRAALAAVQHLRAVSPDDGGILNALRQVGYARSRFQAAVRFALERSRSISWGTGRVRVRTAEFERADGKASWLTYSLLTTGLSTAIDADREAITKTWWLSLVALALAVASAAALWRQLVSHQRVLHARDLARDEAQRLQIAERLAITESQLDAIFDRASVGVAIFDPLGRLLRANAALEMILDQPTAASVGARSDRFADLAAGDIEGFTFQSRVERGDESRFVRSDFTLIRDPAGQPRFILALVHDTTEQTLSERRLQFEAKHDPLTRLPNRAYLLERMQSSYFGDLPPSGICAAAYIQIDGGEELGFGSGRASNEETTVSVARRLVAAVDPNAFVARFDGDAFVVLLDALPDRRAATIAVERIVARLSESRPDGERDIRLTANAGVALIDRHYGSPLEILRDAEIAVRDARTQGRSTVRTCSQDLFDRALRRSALARALPHAVERDQMFLEYQPLVSSGDRSICGFEALIRWEHPELGRVSPVEFISLAEEMGVIVPMGRWVIDRACSQLATWRSAGVDVGELTVAINASVHEIVRPEYAGYLQRTMARYGIAASQIIVEVTESAVLQSDRYASGSLESLSELGVGLAIDDFGTGYSSMRYLLEFPFSKLKIDASFVRGADGGLASEAIVGSLVRLARSFGLTTVAEGVETQVQADALVRLGVDDLQGYLFGRPSPASSIPELLRTLRYPGRGASPAAKRRRASLGPKLDVTILESDSKLA